MPEMWVFGSGIAGYAITFDQLQQRKQRRTLMNQVPKKVNPAKPPTADGWRPQVGQLAAVPGPRGKESIVKVLGLANDGWVRVQEGGLVPYKIPLSGLRRPPDRSPAQPKPQKSAKEIVDTLLSSFRWRGSSGIQYSV